MSPEKIDALLVTSPRKALLLAEAAIELASSRSLWRHLGALASARRATGDFAGAEAAMLLAERHSPPTLAAQLELARRMSRLQVDLGRYERARPLIEYRVAHERGTAKALAQADLAALVYASGGPKHEAMPMLNGALRSRSAALRRYGWQLAALFAIADGDLALANRALSQLSGMPKDGMAGVHYRWLLALQKRQQGQCEASRRALLAIANDVACILGAAAAGTALIDAAISALRGGDLAAVQADAGRAFALLAKIDSQDAKAALKMFLRAAQTGQLTEQLALDLRKRLR